MSELRRYCFVSQVNPAHLGEYKERHSEVWPDMLRALRDSGWHNYSLFLTPEGQLIGYVESEDLDLAQAKMAATDVNVRWQSEIARLFADPDTSPDEGMVFVEQIFNLEDQLAAAEAAGE